MVSTWSRSSRTEFSIRSICSRARATNPPSASMAASRCSSTRAFRHPAKRLEAGPQEQPERLGPQAQHADGVVVPERAGGQDPAEEGEIVDVDEGRPDVARRGTHG